MPKQLTIFDVERVSEFNIKRAKVQYSSSQVRYVDVIVQVPRRVKATDELKQTTTYDEKYELFEDYTIGIWRYKRAEDQRFGWEKAEELCKQARDNKQPIPIRLYLSVEQTFIPEDVVQYL
ncbi:cell division protein SepF [Bacillus sp. BP-3]|uniref:cell division protein SepF n=1 Tax=Bacillus sp. BP-3 TaxID=3022773 RepID=UPI00232ED182|nr:cell division protein SepF [Bacillus sp. BP-3]MDC2864678.1 cell division protein SepF [Bacillus sp. BP-3]